MVVGPHLISLRDAYRSHREQKGEPRERLIASALAIALPDNFKIQLVDGELQARTPFHLPDIRIYRDRALIAELEITGVDIPWSKMRFKGKVFVLPSKVEYAEKAGERYIFVFVNDAHLFSEDDWLLWLPGPGLVHEANMAEIWTGETSHHVLEQYYLIPRSRFRTGWRELVGYIRYLAGELLHPDPDNLANFMG